MVTQPAYLKAFKDYTRIVFGDDDQMEEVLADLSNESDRGAVILAATGIEDSLEMTLMQRMTALHTDGESQSAMFGANGVCSTFAAKTLVAYALGIIDQELRDRIDLVRVIRNGCAHGRLPISFERPELQGICKVVLGAMLGDLKDQEPPTLRAAFVMSCTAIQMSVLHRRRVSPEEAYRMALAAQKEGDP